MTRSLFVLLALTLAAPPAARSSAPGEAAPRFGITEWINHPPVGEGAFDGRVLVLCFIRLEQENSFDYMQPWQELADRYALAPVSFVAVTNESPKYIKEEFERERMSSVVAINPERRRGGRLRRADLPVGGRRRADRHHRLSRQARPDQRDRGRDQRAAAVEAALCIVSMVRSDNVHIPDGADATPENFERAMRRAYGFLASGERMNVMFSRAMRNLVVVGNLDYFSKFNELFRGWLNATDSMQERGELERQYGFWGKLIAQFKNEGDILRIDAGEIEGLIE